LTKLKIYFVIIITENQPKVKNKVIHSGSVDSDSVNDILTSEI